MDSSCLTIGLTVRFNATRSQFLETSSNPENFKKHASQRHSDLKSFKSTRSPSPEFNPSLNEMDPTNGLTLGAFSSQ